MRQYIPLRWRQGLATNHNDALTEHPHWLQHYSPDYVFLISLLYIEIVKAKPRRTIPTTIFIIVSP